MQVTNGTRYDPAALLDSAYAPRYRNAVASATVCVDRVLAALLDNDPEAAQSWAHATRAALCGTVRVVWEGDGKDD